MSAQGSRLQTTGRRVRESEGERWEEARDQTNTPRITNEAKNRTIGGYFFGVLWWDEEET